jgi:hypothetical protein
MSAPTNRQCARAALLAISVFWFGLVLGEIKLPFDPEYNAVIYLMWSGAGAWQPFTAWIRFALFTACFLLPIALLGRLLWSRKELPSSYARFWNLCYRYALVLPAGYVVATSFSRYVANAVYVSASGVTWDFTSYIAALELPLLELIQETLDSPQARSVCSWLYSVGWYLPMATLVPFLAARDEAAAVNRVLTAQLLTAVAAIPFFVALPVFEPWTLNGLYGNSGSIGTNVRFLYPNADIEALGQVARDLRWAAGSCLPSLHFAFPFVSGLVLWQSRLRVIGGSFLVLAAVTAYTIVFLGRHWIADVLAAIPYSLGITWLSVRFALRFTLTEDRPSADLLSGDAVHASTPRSRVQ